MTTIQTITTLDTTSDRFRIWEYDAQRRRLWILGQRCHHGMTGSLLALAGAVLMVHDWKDRTIWFQLGRGTQP